MPNFEAFTDHQGRTIRLTDERWEHINAHPEMVDQRQRLVETLVNPDNVIVTTVDASVHAYQRGYVQTPVTSKFLIVVVKILTDDAFIITAYYSSRQKKGDVQWQK